MTENELRNAVCAQARAWLGRQESDNSHREIIDLYNRYKKPGDYHMTYVDPWCAAFSSACGMAASVAVGLPCKPYELIPSSAACDPKIAQYKAMGRWMEDDNYLPSPGDEAFYDWDDSGYGDNMGSSDHVGIVVSVSGSSITVVEGNKSDSVSYRVIQRNGRYIRGYGLPDYAGYAAKAPNGVATAVPPSGISEPTPQPAQEQPRESYRTPAAKYHAHVYEVDLNLLKTGDKGPLVQSLQLLLNGKGFPCGKDDGEFGTDTRDALVKFQTAAGILADGECGGQTWAALHNYRV